MYVQIFKQHLKYIVIYSVHIEVPITSYILGLLSGALSIIQLNNLKVDFEQRARIDLMGQIYW